MIVVVLTLEYPMISNSKHEALKHTKHQIVWILSCFRTLTMQYCFGATHYDVTLFNFRAYHSKECFWLTFKTNLFFSPDKKKSNGLLAGAKHIRGVRGS